MRVTNYESSNECEDYHSRCDTCVILILIRLEQGNQAGVWLEGALLANRFRLPAAAWPLPSSAEAAGRRSLIAITRA